MTTIEHTEHMHILDNKREEGISAMVAGIIIALAALFFVGVSSASAQMYGNGMPQLPVGQSGMPLDTTFTALLSPGEEVPPTTSSARGRAHFNLSQSQNGTVMHYQLIMHDGENITAAHLHCGERGVSGPAIVNLFTGPAMASVHGELSNGTIRMQDILSAGATCSPNIRTIAHLAQAMREGKIYANVHSTRYPDGEIRGQVSMHMPNGWRDIPVTYPTSTMNGMKPTSTPVSGGIHISGNGIEIHEMTSTRPGTSNFMITISHDLLRQIANMLPNMWQMIQAHLNK